MQGITEQKTRAYFLGDLGDEDAFAFEMETAASADLTDFVRSVETALVDDFVAGRLSASAGEKFTRVYLTTPARLKRCKMAAGLRQLVAERNPERAVAPPLSNWFEHNVLSRKKFVTFLVGLGVLICLGLAIWVSSVRSEDQVLVAEVLEPETTPILPEGLPETPADNPPPVSVRREDQIAKASPKQTRKNRFEAEMPRKVAKASLAPARAAVPASRSLVVKLLPGRGPGTPAQPVTIAPDVDRVLVMLSPGGDPNKYKSLHAVIKTPEDATVYSSPELNSLSFMIQASRLENRTYVVTLEGKNGENRYERIANYTFMIKR